MNLEYNFIALFSTILGPIIYIFSGQYKGIIRYPNSIQTLNIFLRNSLIIFIIYFSSFYFYESVPLNEFLIYLLVMTSIISCTRYFLKELIVLSQKKLDIQKPTNIVIFSPLKNQNKSIDFFRSNPNYNIISILDTSLSGVGRYMYNIPVEKPSHINKISGKVEKILIDNQNISRSQMNKILELVSPLGLPLLKIPSFDELLIKGNSTKNLKLFSLEDLLGREEVAPKDNLIGPSIAQKTILITGGGGSIGSELTKQIALLKASRVIILELSEFNLFEIVNDINKIKDTNKLNLDIIPILGSACDESLVANLFKKFKIDCVFHAAAYKHVSIVEQNPLQGLKNNINSTLLLCKYSFKHSIQLMLLISSDKAVRPTNIMGVSKRISELIIQIYAIIASDKKTIFSLVRFGNVIGSSGSVIPIFIKQISKGGPLYVTHKNVVRYFMTISEAVNLILQASFLAKAGDILLLDMGEPVNIYQLAKQMIILSGYKIKDKENIDGDIEVKISGLKKGEKIYEELLISGKSTSTIHPRIFKGCEEFNISTEIFEQLKSLNDFIDKNNLEGCFEILKKIVPEWDENYEPESSNIL